MYFRFTSSTEDGYVLVHARTYLRLDPSACTAASTCSGVHIPVDRIVGLPVAASFFRKEMSVTSADATL